MNRKIQLFEDGRKREVTRTIVRDIVQVFKDEDEGEYYLPNYVNDEHDFYNFAGLDMDLAIELVITPKEDIPNFKVDANYFRDDDIIQIEIEYNTKNKKKLLYDLVGELNEVIAHEIKHVNQNITGSHDLNVPEPSDPYEYYTQEHELDAQKAGFRRLAKLTKTPMDVVVKRWFKTHKDIHGLTEKESMDVISKILN
jgi:hypothetical protein